MGIYITGIDKHTLATYLNSKGHSVLIDIPKYTGKKRVVEIKTPHGDLIDREEIEVVHYTDADGEHIETVAPTVIEGEY